MLRRWAELLRPLIRREVRQIQGERAPRNKIEAEDFGRPTKSGRDRESYHLLSLSLHAAGPSVSRRVNGGRRGAARILRHDSRCQGWMIRDHACDGDPVVFRFRPCRSSMVNFAAFQLPFFPPKFVSLFFRANYLYFSLRVYTHDPVMEISGLFFYTCKPQRQPKHAESY